MKASGRRHCDALIFDLTRGTLTLQLDLHLACAQRWVFNHEPGRMSAVIVDRECLLTTTLSSQASLTRYCVIEVARCTTVSLMADIAIV